MHADEGHAFQMECLVATLTSIKPSSPLAPRVKRAVLDPRLATARSYRWELINALPPMTRTKDRNDVTRFLQELRDDEVGQ